MTVSVDRKVSPGYGFTAVPECKNCISAPPHLPAAPCRNAISALLRKLFDLLSIYQFCLKIKLSYDLKFFNLFSKKSVIFPHSPGFQEKKKNLIRNPLQKWKKYEIIIISAAVGQIRFHQRPYPKTSFPMFGPPLLLPGLTIGSGGFRIDSEPPV
jgi:hypothetical protein